LCAIIVVQAFAQKEGHTVGQRSSGKKLSDIAQELGVSISTVSRAISGTGRTSEKTRSKVRRFIGEDFSPNKIASALAKGKTFNICALFPDDSGSFEYPFFQKCLMGINQEASLFQYDVIVSDSRHLSNLLSSNKADGYIVTRAVDDDPAIMILKESGVPFVLIGSSADPSVVQVDADNEGSAYKLGMMIKEKGCHSSMLLLGPMNYMVNRSRKAGVQRALDCVTAEGIESMDDVQSALNKAKGMGCDMVICGDDNICLQLFSVLRKTEGYMPEVATLYDNEILPVLGHVVSCRLSPDARQLGVMAAKHLLAEK
jgi:DNA-binding LacI/PurR family transcriptional regulator